jgi:2-polyprenyl-6-methoxyphenol hydroxylase-like FAD-dependent oxidoreductase
VLVLPQSAFQRELEQALGERNISVQWQHQALDVVEADERITAHIARMEKYSLGYPVAHTEWMVDASFDVTTRYVVAADGYHSFVRHRLGLVYEQVGDPETFTVFEFACRMPVEHEVRVVFHEGTVNVLWPLGPGRGRWTFQVASPEDHSYARENLERLIRERAPWFDAPIDEIVWTATTLFERRLVNSFGRGRVWLAGDAAHITGPVGVQSMNVGLEEAYELATGISAQLHGSGPDALAHYGAACARRWRQLLGAGTGAPLGPATPDWARELGPRLVACVPAAGADLTTLLAQVGLRLAG